MAALTRAGIAAATAATAAVAAAAARVHLAAHAAHAQVQEQRRLLAGIATINPGLLLRRWLLPAPPLGWPQLALRLALRRVVGRDAERNLARRSRLSDQDWVDLHRIESDETFWAAWRDRFGPDPGRGVD